MGTNYYVHGATNSSNGKHFGKLSAGWDFALHVYPDEGIFRLEDWLLLLSDKNVEVRDGYNKRIKVKPLLRKVLGLDRKARLKPLPQKDAIINPFTDRLQPTSGCWGVHSIHSSYYCLNCDFC
tara:strand:- start:496 stop:864 length:369 start_codon:yes stop_codon:yes gene_type:complete